MMAFWDKKAPCSAKPGRAKDNYDAKVALRATRPGA